MIVTRSAGIIGMGMAVPDKVLTNADLEKMVDTSDEWIRSMTGIAERRIATPGQTTSYFAIEAARKALAASGISADQIGMVIMATITGDMPFPATASIVQDGIGAGKCPAFDVSAGCSGWVYALSAARAYIAGGDYDYILVIGADLLSTITNWQDRSTCILFGDAAGAAVVGPVEDGFGILALELGSDGSGARFLNLPVGGSSQACTAEDIACGANKIHMEGREVFKFAVKIQGEAVEKALAKAGISIDEVDLIVPHQANIRIIDSAAKRLGVPMEKFYVNVDRYGNTSAASIPVALDEAILSGRVRKGDTIVTVGFGAGLTWASGVMKWAY